MTTFTSASNTSFSIKLTTENFNSPDKTYSDRVKLYGLEWDFYIYKSDEDTISAFLHCYGNNSNTWSVTVENTMLLYANDGATSSITRTDELSCEQKDSGYAAFTNVSNVNEHFVHEGKLTIGCCVEIKSISGNQPERKHDFQDKDSELNDVTLMVEERPFYAGRQMLSCVSPVFHAMFFSDFKEKSENVITLKEVKFDEFERFLQLLYQCSVEIDAANVDSLLMLADRFNTPMITQRCESFLSSTAHIKNNEKLEYAEKYSLLGLQMKCINTIETIPAYEEMCVDVEKRNKTTLVGLIHKAIVMMKKMTTATSTATADP